MKNLFIAFSISLLPFWVSSQNIEIGDDAKKVNTSVEFLVRDHNRVDTYGNQSNSIWEYNVKYFDGKISEVINCCPNQFDIRFELVSDFCVHYIMANDKLNFILTQYINISTKKLIDLYDKYYQTNKIEDFYFTNDYSHYSKIYLSKDGFATVEYRETRINEFEKSIRDRIQPKYEEGLLTKMNKKQAEEALNNKEENENTIKEQLLRSKNNFDDSVKKNTFPMYHGFTSSFGPNYVHEIFFIEKKNDGELKAQWVNQDKRIVNINDDVKIKYKKLGELPIDSALQSKITNLMLNKINGIYYLSVYVNDGFEEISKGKYIPIKKIEIHEFYKGQYNKPKEAYKENDITYQVICDDCEIRFADKDGFGIKEDINVNKVWTYNFNSPSNISKYKTNPLDFYTPVLYGHSGQYIYLTAKSKNPNGKVNLKIIRDGEIWKESSNVDKTGIVTLSGCLP
jgi:hypothetical protein